jgi:hypothetical protein
MSMTALHTAARDGNVELVKDILVGKNGQVKVLINSQNAVGQTPLHLAAKWGRLGVIECLIEEGAGVCVCVCSAQPHSRTVSPSLTHTPTCPVARSRSPS